MHGSLERCPNRNFAPDAAGDYWAAGERTSPFPRCREAVRYCFECGDETPEAARASWTDRTPEAGSRSLHFVSRRAASRGGGMGEWIRALLERAPRSVRTLFRGQEREEGFEDEKEKKVKG